MALKNHLFSVPDWSALFEPLATHNDPLLPGYWHLGGTAGVNKGVNVLDVWDEFRGAGIIVGLIDDGVEYTHPELVSNYNTALDFDARNNDFDAYTSDPTDRHGTTVAGVIAAELDNGLGGSGVAPEATLVGYRIGFGANGSEGQMEAVFERVSDLDVANNSWGYDGFLSDDFISPDFAPVAADLEAALNTGRDGLGTIVVFSAGNSRAQGQDVNYHNFQNYRGVITVAATGSGGTITGFSTPGDAILVAAPGAGIQTTDRVGTPGYSSGDVTTISGTSFSAPIVSGVAALMLDANPNLGWRDVQEILASTAIQTGSAASWSFNHAGNWNGGAMHVSRDFGFGLVNAMAAVRVAESWHQVATSANEVVVSALIQPNLAIPDLGAAQSVLNLAAGVRIDHVEVDLEIAHTNIAHLRVVLTSPIGTQSVLFNNAPTGQDDISFTFSTTHDWGELSGGAWTLSVSDTVAGTTGTLQSWSIRAYGDPVGNDTYVYTDEFSSLAPADSARQSLADAGGIDNINTAAIATATSLDLRPGQTSVVDGQSVTISLSTIIENADTGDGNDTITGNDAANWLRGWRGNDILDGGLAADTLQGGVGNDIYAVNEVGDVVVENAGEGTDTVQSTLTYSLASTPNLENVTLLGSGAVNATGNGASNVVTGNIAANILNGGTGVDTLVGGPGDDTYVVDSTTDTITENVGEGIDTVQASVTYSIAAAPNLENVRLTGGGAINATGNALNNMLTGNDSSNTLEGGAGDDLIYGFDPNGPQANVSSITATRVAVGLGEPLFAVSPRGDLERLFIVEKTGRIKILDLATQQVLPTAFLDLSQEIRDDGEEGLLGLAFDPDYAQNGVFYVNVSNPNGDTEIRRYEVSSTNPNQADAASASLVITIDQPAGLTNHKGGWLDFGRDGYLYAALGDGGGSGDPGNNAQNPTSLLGKMLRLDVDGDNFPADSTRNYAIPTDNPFATSPAADEIWALGLRNPWRPSFDRGLGQLYIADVGQSTLEEINIGVAGANYGWKTFEGTGSFSPTTPLGPGTLTAPIHTYGRSVGQSITGGYVYRGTSEGLHGQYFFADFVASKIFTLRFDGNSWIRTERTVTPNIGTINNPSSFGQDGAGDLYVIDFGGEVFKLTPNVVSADQGDVLLGMAGDDILFGGSGDDTLNGGGDNDELQGGAGADLLDGAQGDDILIGGIGNDQYVFNSGFGRDVISDNDATAGNVDTISFGAGIAPGAVAVARVGNDLKLTLGTDAVTVQDWYAGNDQKVERVQFADGTVWDVATILAMTGGNQAPVLANAIADRPASEDAVFNFVVAANAFSDPDAGDTLTYSATRGDGTALPSWLAFNAATRTFSGTPLNGDVGVLSVKVIATDPGGLSASDIFNVTVANTNDAPTLANPIADQSASESSAFSFVVPLNAFADVDIGDTLTYSATRGDGTALPAWVTFTAATRTFSGTPGAGDVGTLSLKVTATDGAAASVADTFVVTVSALSGPTINGTAGNDTLNGTAANDTINGLAGIDTLNGLGGSDTLDGGVGADTMAGGAHNDTYFVDNAGDIVSEGANAGTDTVKSSITYTLGANLENLTLIGGSIINGTGNALNNVMLGNSAANTLSGGSGNDAMSGGAGDDIYVVESALDSVLENAGEGIDLVRSSVTFTLGANVENLTLTGTGAVNAIGNDLNNVITGNAGTNTLSGGLGDDTLVITGTNTATDTVKGGDGFDVLQGGSGDDTFRFHNYSGVNTVESIVGGMGVNVIAGSAFNNLIDLSGTLLTDIAKIDGGNGDDVLTGSAGADVILGGAGADTLRGGAGDDTLIGDSGDDRYAFSTGFSQDVISDNDATAGNVDTISFGAGITPDEVAVSRLVNDLKLMLGTDEIIVQDWYAGNDQKVERVQFADGTVWDVATILAMTGGNQAPVLANAIADRPASEDAVFNFVVAANAFSDPDAGDTLTYSATRGDGTALPSWLAFNAATRTFSGTPLNGDVGVLSVKVIATDPGGLSASDIFNVTVANTNDAPTLANPIADQSASESSAFSFVVPLNAFADVDIGDTLTYSATRGDGTALPAWVTFTAATRTFSGTPGAGDVGTLSLKVTATDGAAASVADTFVVTVSALSGPTINGTAGNDTLNGTAANDTINGLAGIDTLNGLGGNDTLNGGSGNDAMSGGAGDDTYVVDSASDSVLENAGEGIDLVRSAVTYTLSANVENLTLTGTGAANATGNDLNNVLTGNAGANTLNGGLGDDTLVMTGISTATDSVKGGDGFDVVQGGTGDDTFRFHNYSGLNTVESIVGGAGVNVIAGSALNNLIDLSGTLLTDIARIDGGDGDDALTGSGGNDALDGGVGADTLRGGAGDDLVNGGAGTGADNLNGNAGTDVLEGMDGNDTLSDTGDNNLFNGGAGTDTLTGNTGNELFIGGAGNDTITTSTGADIIAFNRGDGQDTVNASTGGGNTLSIGGGIRYADMSLTRNGNNLELNLGGSAEKVTLANWYLSAPANKSVINLQVIAEAMSDFNANSADPLLNKKVQSFDFTGLASAFDAAGAPNSWALMNALLSEHFASSDTEALGGDMAYRYGLAGSLANIGFDPAVSILSNASFGSAAQALQPLQDLQQGTKRLS